ncbi:MAG: DUF5684 domain-containing protein [Peptostreptococcaceae bacterium]|nr:DUF5684 domain-containing protein [Peptostreptococcaceae bacterium]
MLLFGSVFLTYFIAIFSLLIAALFIVANWKIFEKAGYEGWKCLIPFYNTYCLCELVFGNRMFLLAFFIPVVNFFFPYYLSYKLGEVFGQSTGYCIAMIFFPLIFMLILAFSDASYQGPSEIRF